MDHQLLSQCKFLKFRYFFLLFTVLMKLKLDTHITYFGFNLNDASFTANAQNIDSATSQFFFSIDRVSGIFISSNICLLLAPFFYENYTNY